MSKLKTVLNKVSMIQIPENAILDGIIRELEGREAFRDTDGSLNERIFEGSVFEQILGEQGEMGANPLRIKEKKVLQQLEELAELVDSDYVQITMI